MAQARGATKPKVSWDIFATIEEGYLVVRIPINDPPKVGVKGKNRTVASTGGLITIPGLEIGDVPVIVSVAAYLPGTGEVPISAPERQTWSSTPDLVIESPWCERMAMANQILGDPMVHPDDSHRFAMTAEMRYKADDSDTAEIAVWFTDAPHVESSENPTREPTFSQVLDAELADSREC